MEKWKPNKIFDLKFNCAFEIIKDITMQFLHWERIFYIKPPQITAKYDLLIYMESSHSATVVTHTKNVCTTRLYCTVLILWVYLNTLEKHLCRFDQLWVRLTWKLKFSVRLTNCPGNFDLYSGFKWRRSGSRWPRSGSAPRNSKS